MKVFQIKKRGEDSFLDLRVVLLGGVDFVNDGSYGTNKGIAEDIVKAASSYGLEIQDASVKLINSPLFTHDPKQVEKQIFDTIIRGISPKTQIILYGYSYGGQYLMEILSLFDSKKIKIDLLITIDAAKGFYSAQVPSSVPNIVSKNLNCYQTVPSRVGSHGHANNGTNVLNVDLSDAKDRNKKTVAHDNIDEYTAFFCVQVILYYAKGLKKLNSMSVENIKKAINTYHQNDRTR